MIAHPSSTSPLGVVTRLMILLLSVLCGQRCLAHEPMMVDAAVMVADGTVSVTIRLPQSAALACLGETRSLFRDPAERARALPLVVAYLTAHTTLTSEQPVRLQHDNVARTPNKMEDWTGPVIVILRGDLPLAADHLALRLDLLTEYGQSAAAVVTAHLIGIDDEQPRSVPSGTTVSWTFAAPSHHSVATQKTALLGDFIALGFRHIMPDGIDHILFVLGLFLLSPKLKPLLIQITAFTFAHSLTLGLAMADLIALPSRVVEPLIALSIVVVAIGNFYRRDVRPARWGVIFVFGLMHGLGFAGALKEIQLPTGGIGIPLVGFNVGVELGQLSVVLIAAGLTAWCRERSWYAQRIALPASACIAAIGLFWVIERGLGYGIDV